MYRETSINKPAAPALSFQMHSRTLYQTISVLLLAIAIDSTCLGADLPKFSVDLTKALNERWTSE